MANLVLGLGLNEFNQICPSQDRRYDAPLALDFQSGGEAPRQVACGARCSYALTEEGGVYEWGYNHGEHRRDALRKEVHLPVPVLSLAAGAKHCLALLEGGSVASWGCGYFGQLGHRDEQSACTPRVIKSLKPDVLGDPISTIAAGAYHSAAVTSRGRLIMWGLNRDGQCCQGHFHNTVKPTFAILQQAVRRVSCGRNHTVAVCTELHSTEDSVFSWGAAGFGRLGVAVDEKACSSPRRVPYFRGESLLDVACGDYHTLALTLEGTVHCWGYGAEGQCGQGNTLHLRQPRPVQLLKRSGICAVKVCAGSWWSCALSTEGDVYCWGYGDGGWLGAPPDGPLPYVEPGDLDHRARRGATKAFDSRFNALLPVRLAGVGPGDGDGGTFGADMACGSGHMLILTKPEPPGIQVLGGTLLDEQLASVSSSGRSRRHGEAHGRSSSTDMTAIAEALVQAKESVADRGPNGAAPVKAEAMTADIGGPWRTLSDEQRRIFSAVRHGRVPDVTDALERGPMITDLRDENGSTLLHVAAQNGQGALCRVFLEHGADINAQDSRGNTPLHLALKYGFGDVAEWMITEGADDTIENASGHRPYAGP